MKEIESCKECNGTRVSQLYIGSMTVYGPCPFCNKKQEPSKAEGAFLSALEKMMGEKPWK